MTASDDLTRILAEHRLLDYPRLHCRCGAVSLSGFGSVAEWEAHLASVVSRRDTDLRTRVEERLGQLTRFVNVRRNWPDPINDDYGRGIEQAVTDIREALDADTHEDDLTEQGRQLASRRDALVAQGVDPSDLAIPLAPNARLDTDTP